MSRVNSMMLGRCRRLALIALRKEAEVVNLPDEVGHAGPPAEPEPNHQNPAHHERVKDVHRCPAWKEKWWFLNRILHKLTYFSLSLSLTSCIYLSRLSHARCQDSLPYYRRNFLVISSKHSNVFNHIHIFTVEFNQLIRMIEVV